MTVNDKNYKMWLGKNGLLILYALLLAMFRICIKHNLKLTDKNIPQSNPSPPLKDFGAPLGAPIRNSVLITPVVVVVSFDCFKPGATDVSSAGNLLSCSKSNHMALVAPVNVNTANENRSGNMEGQMKLWLV
jgi:hypothetical protein